jgi:nucleoside-diphosphate-sugar epimerase
MSSSMVYGNFESEDVKEDRTCKPIGIYGTLKYSGELLVKAYSDVFDLPYTIIRPSALYGERCVSRRVGQIFIENAIQNLDITINGSGEEKLDFTYIEDLINGIGLCCSNKNAINQTFNLTYGKSKKINELTEVLKNEFPNIKFFYKEKEKFMPERGTLDVSKAKKLIGYNPINPIDTGYIKYISWYKKFWNHLKRD